MSSMTDRLRPLGGDVQRLYLRAVFGKNMSDREQRFSCGSYFEVWYNEHCKLIKFGARDQRPSHSEIVEVISSLKGDKYPLTEIRRKLKDQDPFLTLDAVDAIVYFAARMWTMMEIENFPSSYYLASQYTFWEDPTLSRIVKNKLFSLRAETFKLSTSGPLPQVFNAENIVRIAGIQICWTSDLLSHLHMTDDYKKVLIFHNVAFLDAHKDLEGSPFPPDFVDETKKSLALLIPKYACAAWFRKEREKHRQSLDELAGTCSPLGTDERHLAKFPYWRDRILTLKRAFDEAQPGTLRQWWYDRRNRVQWWTFWIALLVLILTIIFGIIGTVTGILQVMIALRNCRC